MKSLTSISKEIWEARKKYFEDYLRWGKSIKKIASEMLGEDVRVIIFGSTVRGDWTPSSDIDILIVSEKLSSNWEENRWIRTQIKRSIGPLSPFQFHLANVEEYQSWWKDFIKNECVEV
ncbi:nucleotidyltransferase domain-containing protein [Pseudothermotoga sp. U03pept]|uniref:nucleotidyltransferase domain-containing protein n=1 Tax=Pseudothermotoga sp. U03pept TaxID=3447012 RepID=UPI003F1204D9